MQAHGLPCKCRHDNLSKITLPSKKSPHSVWTTERGSHNLETCTWTCQVSINIAAKGNAANTRSKWRVADALTTKNAIPAKPPRHEGPMQIQKRSGGGEDSPER